MSYYSKYTGEEAESILDSVRNKVDKIDGKQLSEEDFTTALKQKLESLNNYDDKELSEAIQSLQSQLNMLVNGDASTAIESFEEIIAFLEGIKDSESLDSIIASIEQQIASKYVKPVQGIPKTDLSDEVQSLLDKADVSANKNKYNNYSTTETKIGTWIDGKPIYRKTIVYTCEDLTKTKYWAYYPADTNATDISQLNIDTYTSMSGVTFCTNEVVTAGAWQPIPRVCPDANENYNIGFGDLKPTRVGVLFGKKYLSATVYLTLEYTKITD